MKTLPTLTLTALAGGYVALVTGFVSVAYAVEEESKKIAEAQEERQARPQRPDRPARPEGRGGGHHGIFQALDANGDGKIGAEEIDLAVASLRKLDKNKDGSLTPDEIGGGRSAMGRPGGDRQSGERPGGQRSGGQRGFSLDRLDTDGDGKISKEEAPERMKERFAQIDGNADGFIDQEEQKVLMETLRKRFAQGGGNRGGFNRGGRGGADEGKGGTVKPKRPPLEE